jgi:hypothetical protein
MILRYLIFAALAACPSAFAPWSSPICFTPAKH